MDDARAARMATELMGTTIGGWTIREYLGAGKSALVFKAEKDSALAALKVFDPELVQRFGMDVQTARRDKGTAYISLEIAVIGILFLHFLHMRMSPMTFPNLV
jgi:hypothetical protein